MPLAVRHHREATPSGARDLPQHGSRPEEPKPERAARLASCHPSRTGPTPFSAQSRLMAGRPIAEAGELATRRSEQLSPKW
jgi:hypothetical protein